MQKLMKILVITLALVVAPVSRGQTQEEAILFLQSAFGPTSDPFKVALTCAQMKFSGDGHSVAFNPREVSIKLLADANGAKRDDAVNFECISVACITTVIEIGAGQRRVIGQRPFYTNGVQSQRVIRAFEFYQKGCGGPIKSSF